MRLAKAISLYSKLIRPKLDIKSLGLVVLKKICLRHMTTLRSLETHHNLGVYSKNTCLANLKLSLNLT